MTTIDRLVERYASGALTVDDLFVQCLQPVDPSNPGAVLSLLPDSSIERFRDFVTSYLPGRMVATYGPLPTRDQVESAVGWLGRSVETTAAGVS